MQSVAEFQVVSDYRPAGDQPGAISGLVEGLETGLAQQTLLGVTGSGKTFAVANVIAEVQRPTLVLAPNKTLAAQLYGEFREFFPRNAVEYFVSYYDYYQPEAYVPSSDTYIEKDASVNAHIEQMRLSATKALLERRDTVIVASVSAIYGLGDPQSYLQMVLHLDRGDHVDQRYVLRRLAGTAIHAQRHGLSARHLPRARRRDRHLPGGIREGSRGVLNCSTTRSTTSPLRSVNRRNPRSGATLHGLPEDPLRHAP